MERNRHKTSVEWPVVVDERLRLLVSLTEQVSTAGPTSASELLAALICQQPIDGKHLADCVMQYRQTEHADLATATHRHTAWSRGPRRGRPRKPSDHIGP